MKTGIEHNRQISSRSAILFSKGGLVLILSAVFSLAAMAQNNPSEEAAEPVVDSPSSEVERAGPENRKLATCT